MSRRQQQQHHFDVGYARTQRIDRLKSSLQTTMMMTQASSPSPTSRTRRHSSSSPRGSPQHNHQTRWHAEQHVQHEEHHQTSFSPTGGGGGGILPLAEELRQRQDEEASIDEEEQQIYDSGVVPAFRDPNAPNTLIDDFIDDCADHNVPEEIIAHHVLFMAKAMQDIISLEAENHRKQQEERALMFDRQREDQSRQASDVKLRRQLFDAVESPKRQREMSTSSVGVQAGPEPHCRATKMSTHREALGKIQRERHKSKLQQYLAPGYRKRFLQAQEELIRRTGVDPDSVPLEDLTLEGSGWANSLRDSSPTRSPRRRQGSPASPMRRAGSGSPGFRAAGSPPRASSGMLAAHQPTKKPQPDLSVARGNKAAELRQKKSQLQRSQSSRSASTSRPPSVRSSRRPSVAFASDAASSSTQPNSAPAANPDAAVGARLSSVVPMQGPPRQHSNPLVGGPSSSIPHAAPTIEVKLEDILTTQSVGQFSSTGDFQAPQAPTQGPVINLLAPPVAAAVAPLAPATVHNLLSPSVESGGEELEEDAVVVKGQGSTHHRVVASPTQDLSPITNQEDPSSPLIQNNAPPSPEGGQGGGKPENQEVDQLRQWLLNDVERSSRANSDDPVTGISSAPRPTSPPTAGSATATMTSTTYRHHQTATSVVSRTAPDELTGLSTVTMTSNRTPDQILTSGSGAGGAGGGYHVGAGGEVLTGAGRSASLASTNATSDYTIGTVSSVNPLLVAHHQRVREEIVTRQPTTDPLASGAPTTATTEPTGTTTDRDSSAAAPRHEQEPAAQMAVRVPSGGDEVPGTPPPNLPLSDFDRYMTDVQSSLKKAKEYLLISTPDPNSNRGRSPQQLFKHGGAGARGSGIQASPPRGGGKLGGNATTVLFPGTNSVTSPPTAAQSAAAAFYAEGGSMLNTSLDRTMSVSPLSEASFVARSIDL